METLAQKEQMVLIVTKEVDGNLSMKQYGDDLISGLKVQMVGEIHRDMKSMLCSHVERESVD